jgi:ketosteroid isomerase-like protein
MRGVDVVLERSRSIGSRGRSGSTRHQRDLGRHRLSWSVFTCCGLGLTAIAADVRAAEKPPAADVSAIRASAAAYRGALEKGDVDAVRKAWTADGDIVDGWGNLLSAKDASAVEGDTKAAPRPQFRFGETRLRFITADVALEDGSADVTLPGTKVPIEGSFTAVWVRQDGTWKIAGLRESEWPVAPSAAMLEDLDWMVGDWVLETGTEAAADDAPPMEMTVRWDAARTFLVRDARLKSRNPDSEPAVVELHQRIGWDPVVGRIRSWSFSTDGSRGEATWFRDGDSWVARGSAVLADGKQMDSVSIYSYDGVGRCVWRIMPEPLASTEGLPTRATWVRKPGSNRK